MQRRGSIQVTADNASQAASQASNVHYVDQLNEMQKNVATLLDEASGKLVSMVPPEGSDDLGASVAAGGLKGVMDWLGRSVRTSMEELSEQHRSSAREALKAQAAVYEAKLDTTRTAATVEKQEQAVALEATMTKKMEANLTAMKADGGEALLEATKKYEELSAEHEKLKMQVSGKDEALSMAKEQIRAAEKSAADWERQANESKEANAQLQAEVERCKETLDRALAELEVAVKSNQSLEDKVKQFMLEAEKLRSDAEEARRALKKALEDLGIVTEENISLTDQVKQLVKKAQMADELLTKVERLEEQHGMLKRAMEKMGEQIKDQKAQLDQAHKAQEAVLAELESEKAANAGGMAALNVEKERVAELETQVKALTDEAALASKKETPLQSLHC